jgi:hypothetical protein
MADLLDIVLNMVGWAVASVITVIGVYLLHRFQERSQQRQDDLTKVYEPLHYEMDMILSQGRDGAYGKVIWPMESGELLSVTSYGRLAPTRHHALRRMVRTLLILHKEHEAATLAFREAVLAAMERAWKRTENVDRDGNAFTLADQLGPESYKNDQLLEALTLGLKERWIERFDNMRQSIGAYQNWRLRTPADTLYEQAYASTQTAREAYEKSRAAFLDHAEKLKYLLGVSIRRTARRRQRRQRTRRYS